MGTSLSSIRALQTHLAVAEDAKLREIVALVDSLPKRGVADGIIAPLRARLQRLRPARMLHVGRLLFVPADCVIIPAASWRRGMVGVPRHVLTCLTSLVRNAMGAEYSALAARIVGTMSDDSESILLQGGDLWPRAATILAQAQMPPEWAGMTGLGLADFTLIVRPLAILLSEAVCIETLVQRGSSGESVERAMRRCLARAQTAIASLPEAADPALTKACLALLLAVCLDRLPDIEMALIAAGDLAKNNDSLAPRQAADAAIDAVLDQADVQLSQEHAGPALPDLLRLAELLETLEQPGPAGRPSRKPRVTALRRALNAHCRARFQGEYATHLLPGASLLVHTTPTDILTTLEDCARNMRRLEAVGRMLGGGVYFERAIADCAKSLPALAPQARRVDLARLVEILQGPEAALAMLDAT